MPCESPGDSLGLEGGGPGLHPSGVPRTSPSTFWPPARFICSLFLPAGLQTEQGIVQGEPRTGPSDHAKHLQLPQPRDTGLGPPGAPNATVHPSSALSLPKCLAAPKETLGQAGVP